MRLFKWVMLLAGAAGVLASFACGGEIHYGDYTITGPYQSGNLEVFFFHAGKIAQQENMMTLEEALQQDKVVVVETGNVGELTIINTGDAPVFIQSGDIVKGGRQDRVIRFDIIVQPGSGEVPLKSFCVERGRWSKRGDEQHSSFGSSNNAVASKEIKLAAKKAASQQEVWAEVDNFQDKLGSNVSAQVRDKTSQSSLQLTLENEAVREKTRKYVDELTRQYNRQDNVVGFAFAINGELNSADIYRSSELFGKYWPKLVEACAIEAVSVLDKDGGRPSLKPIDIKKWLIAADTGDSKDQAVAGQMRVMTRENKDDVVFETYDNEDGDWIHKNVIRQ